MFVRIDVSKRPPAVSLEEPQDTGRFHVEVRGGGAAHDQALVFGALVDAAAGRLDGDDAWVTVDAVRRLAAGRVGPTWDAGLAAMLDYARGQGWFDEAAHAIKAHVEWVG
jgi:hypothetical protein